MIIRLVINHVGLCSSLLSSLTHSSCVRSFTCESSRVDRGEFSRLLWGGNPVFTCSVHIGQHHVRLQDLLDWGLTLNPRLSSSPAYLAGNFRILTLRQERSHSRRFVSILPVLRLIL